MGIQICKPVDFLHFVTVELKCHLRARLFHRVARRAFEVSTGQKSSDCDQVAKTQNTNSGQLWLMINKTHHDILDTKQSEVCKHFRLVELFTCWRGVTICFVKGWIDKKRKINGY